MPPCTGDANAEASIALFQYGQTHLVDTDWPFQTVVEARPLTLAVGLTGNGAAPAVEISGSANGQDLGTVCATGPGQLSGSLPTEQEARLQALHTVTLPSAWVQKGLELTVNAGGATQTIAVPMRQHAPHLVYVLDAIMFGEGQEDGGFTDDHAVEYLARLPASELHLGREPFGRLELDRLYIGSRDDGKAPDGSGQAHGPIVVDEWPHCSDADKAAQSCAPHSGFGTMSGILNLITELRRANALHDSSWYLRLGKGLGGGLGGGLRGTGDNFAKVMNHELGHGHGFPHWNTSHEIYPYDGERPSDAPRGGGFGRTWVVDQYADALAGPLCDDGAERQSPMQRGGGCGPDRFDYHSDYEVQRILDQRLGRLEEEVGTVPYQGGEGSYTLQQRDGWVHWNWVGDRGAELVKADPATDTMVPHPAESMKAFEPTEIEVPVRMFWGAYLHDVPGQESFFYAPVDYYGVVLRPVDPATAEGLDLVREVQRDWYYWNHDISMRFVLDDGTVLHRLLAGEHVAEGDRLAGYFAVNLPLEVGERVVRAEVLRRRFSGREESVRVDDTTQPGDFYADATVLATWEP